METIAIMQGQSILMARPHNTPAGAFRMQFAIRPFSRGLHFRNNLFSDMLFVT
jgi:hypothetical protein